MFLPKIQGKTLTPPKSAKFSITKTHEKTTIINGKLSIPLQMAGTIILSRTTSLVLNLYLTVTAGSLG